MNRWRLPGGIVVLLSLFVAMLTVPTTVLGDDLTRNPQTLDAPIASLWARTDGAQALAGSNHGWLWGPYARSVTKEPYLGAPGGARTVIYFDKARMEINNTNANPQSPWYVTSGLLVREMISGRVQIGDNTFIATDPAQIPVTGDVSNNPTSPTYAALASVASLGSSPGPHSQPARVGQPITDLLRADGTVVAGAVTGSTVRVSTYDAHLGHNVADVFTQWVARQPYPQDYVLGYALTDPYWVDTVVGGTHHQVLMQAFQRRVLTYTPSNPPGWQVEAGNVGIDYRIWRGLTMPSDQNLVPLAAGVPDGEVIVAQAVAHGIDPYLFAALAQVASGYNPLATAPNGGEGLFAVRPEVATGAAHPLDPVINAELAAAQLASLRRLSTDWRAVLGMYYTGTGNPNWSDPGLNAFVNGVLNTEAKVISNYKIPPAALLGQIPPPPPPPPPAPVTTIGTGAAAYYSPNYTVAWWEHTLQEYASWGNIAPNWSLDPNGYYCVNPDFKPGQRLELTANGVTLWCTIGDEVAAGDVANWRAHWVVELSYNTFIALHLDRNNVVTVARPS
ncbi:MAG TPA: transglycosylase SLT domain-containing protein [Thermomicrobiaceae bacterium]|nr:transglycosylase SLT domain-containing protein [Thermomicrobiaceae bacterium]